MSIMSRLRKLLGIKPKVSHTLESFNGKPTYYHEAGDYNCTQYSDGELIVFKRRWNLTKETMKLRDPDTSYGLDGSMSLELDEALSALDLSLIKLYEYHSILKKEELNYQNKIQDLESKWGLTKQ